VPPPLKHPSWIDEAAEYACSDTAFVVGLVVLVALLVAFIRLHM
jgi:hypothetical protein